MVHMQGGILELDFQYAKEKCFENITKHTRGLVVYSKLLFYLYCYHNFLDLLVGVSRLDESKGYEISEAEELAFFLFFSISMVLFQLLYLFFVSRYFKKKEFQKPLRILNLVAHFLLILWFIFSVYQFTINGY